MKKLNEEQEKLWNKITDISNEYQNKLDVLHRKQTGIYYTALDLTDTMIENVFKEFDVDFKSTIEERKFLEPCVGTGNFVFSYLKYIYQNFELDSLQVSRLIANVYVADADSRSINIFLEHLKEFVQIFWGIEIPRNFEVTNVGGPLIYDIQNRSLKKLSPQDYFGISKFDIIITNPPYKGFRAENKHYKSNDIYELDKEYYCSLRKTIKEEFLKQGSISPNLYKIFVESILCDYLSDGGYSYLLIPQSILKDKSTKELRNHILDKMSLVCVKNIDEQTKYVDANQALSALLIKNEGITDTIVIENHFGTSKSEIVETKRSYVKKNLNSAIVGLSNSDSLLIEKLHSYPKLKDLPYITNMRGEFDVTNNKKSICVDGEYQILKGRNLAGYNLKNLDNVEYVTSNFVKKTKKSKYIYSERISCPQISNMNTNKRLFFSYIPANYILANSCNFIHVSNNEHYVDLYYLLALLNSDVYNWYFKLFSSNNHISNYEIDSLPIPILGKKIHSRLSFLAKKHLFNNDDSSLAEINKIVYDILYEDININQIEENYTNYNLISDLTKAFTKLKEEEVLKFLNKKKSLVEISEIASFSSFDLKVFSAIIEKYSYIENNEVLNHTSFKLSDLDIEMVKSVSPGGNWKEIPLQVAEKSKRLMKIRETGGRTTLYGRLNYNEPSYTITTYFNRPGNGTNIHPTHNRVLSVREAARIQSFPDTFFFYGNKKNKLEQIGNAVPPLVAYQIAQKIKENIEVNNSLDLFNGAGGMTMGFKMAGYKSILMNDINEAALVTAKVNYPSSNAYLGDLSAENDRNYIVNFSNKNGVDIVNGGPPCQGFSLAGYRDLNDPRSKLILDYAEVLKGVSPKVFVFENVQGILSHNKGETFKELMNLFLEIGYIVEARLLNFSDYGIPQKRKRVIIIGTRNDLNIDPKKLFPVPITIEESEKITVKQAIWDLEDIPLDSESYYSEAVESEYVKVLKGRVPYNTILKK